VKATEPVHSDRHRRGEHGEDGDALHPVLATGLTAVGAWVVLVALALLLGAVVTNLVVGHPLGRGDLDVARWFTARRTDAWNTASLVGSWFAETVTVLVVLVVALTVLGVRRCWAQAGLLVVAMSAEGATYLFATYLVSRNRPAVPRLEDLIVADSFPSGHTAASVALYGSLCVVVWSLSDSQLWRGVFLALAIVAPIVVGTSRVYRGMHNVTDVVSGAAIGAGCIVVGYVAVRAGLAAAAARRAPQQPRRPAGILVEEAIS
jgi:undecaprenyl-diphosphatase